MWLLMMMLSDELRRWPKGFTTTQVRSYRVRFWLQSEITGCTLVLYPWLYQSMGDLYYRTHSPGDSMTCD